MDIKLAIRGAASIASDTVCLLSVCVLAYLAIALPESYCRVCMWKNSENCLAFGKAKAKKSGTGFHETL